MTHEQEKAIQLLVYTRWIVFADGVETPGDELTIFECFEELGNLEKVECDVAYEDEIKKPRAFAEPCDQALWLDFVRWDALGAYDSRTPEQEAEFQQLETSRVKRERLAEQRLLAEWESPQRPLTPEQKEQAASAARAVKARFKTTPSVEAPSS